ncbi:MAG: hypothetical protein A3I77_00140 [Gammaproteobacteria bacterium RIFCSPLOWO2_02_FULL_42_14]|nr:MAG: hypothetical protein A3B71_00140 [Gammaproteobacteria bacterium RIFCSPHIGHO2_02_FULL_42_43]OGT51901.1 MAG: hypothetical protein A3E54_01165 [Gammaproteobacteria bacterium RIFCSPHIGHO2_12_FULL_41_25]OGT62415.1 MAG: hypothetical protein A3I77_00140 [Gammaproteobacteria bacterium RIFCSPLOWO2_02_FULL_42_14]OGT85367.1 MAG: hypothetical protein A3G86_08090 [Gammaproteobacteria bacterium RIFCSPLOWO2_12_FULL_42_18]
MTKNSNGHLKEETAIPFPCDFILKIMGRADGDFEKKALAIVTKHFPRLDPAHIEKKFSKDKNFLSLSITVFAESKMQLDALYQELSHEKSILMVL